MGGLKRISQGLVLVSLGRILVSGPSSVISKLFCIYFRREVIKMAGVVDMSSLGRMCLRFRG